MSTQTFIVPAGTQLAPQAVFAGQSVCAGPQVILGTALLEFSPTQSGPWTAWSAGASTAAASFRPAVNQWIRVTAATQAAAVVINDFPVAAGFTAADSVISSSLVMASASVTTETVLYSFRTPPSYLRPNFRMNIRAAASFTNNVNAKTLQVRMNGVAGTLAFQSTALASLANVRFDASIVGIGDGATLKGVGSGLTSVGLGTSATAFTTLARDYINNETEFVITATKATAGDTFQLDSLSVTVEQ